MGTHWEGIYQQTKSAESDLCGPNEVSFSCDSED